MSTTLFNIETVRSSEARHASSGMGVEMRGVAASSGRHTAKVRVICDEREIHNLEAGDIFFWAVGATISPTLLRMAGAVVIPGGGALSSSATLAREYGVPAVVGIGPSIELLRDGQVLEVDGFRGVIRAIV